MSGRLIFSVFFTSGTEGRETYPSVADAGRLLL